MVIARAGESRELVEAVSAARPVVVCGPAGIGKTTLLRAAAASSGRRVFEGGGVATLRGIAYLPLSRALGHDADADRPAAVAVLTRRRVGAGVLIVDDLQWADDGTLAVLELLAGSLPVLAAVRQADPGARAVLARLVGAGYELLTLAAPAHGNPYLLANAGPALGLGLSAWLLPQPAAVKEAAARLALLGRAADPSLLGPAVETLVEAGLAVRRGTQVELLHHLIGKAALESLTDDARRRMHAALALEAAETARTPGERARHLGLAARLTRDDVLRMRAALALSEIGDHEGVLTLADSVDARGRLAAGACLAAGRALFALRRVEAARARVAEGIVQASPGAPELVDLWFETARMAGFDWDAEPATRAGRRLLALAGGPRVQARAQLALGIGAFCSESADCIAHASAAGRLAAAAGDPLLELEAGIALAVAALEFGSVDESLAAAAATEARARRLGVPARVIESRALALHGQIFRAGRFEAAIDAGRELLRTDGVVGEWNDRVRGLLAYALAATGDDEEAMRVLGAEGESATRDGRLLLGWARAETEWLGGRPAAALRAARRARRSAGAAMDTRLSVVEAWAAHDSGSPLPPLPEPLARHTGRGLWEELRALHLLAGGDPHAAEAGLLAAAARHDTYYVAAAVRCRWAAGRAALAAGERARAREHLLRAEADASAHGLLPLERRIRSALRATGVNRAAPRGTVGSLSRREREVLELVGRGLTSTKIAARLQIAPSTVDSLVRSARIRLGARTRRQAVLLAAAEGER